MSDLSSELKNLTDRIIPAIPLPTQDRIIVIIGGPPGAGKTTLARALAERLILDSNGAIAALAISMDGFHYSREELKGFADPENALLKRGAPFTFNLEKIVKFVEELRKWLSHDPETTDLFVPEFDHAKKDPIPKATKLPTSARRAVLIFEGNYLLLDEPGWRTISSIGTHRIFLNVDSNEARERLARRHLAAGIVDTKESAIWRAINIDGENASLILNKKLLKEIDQELP